MALVVGCGSPQPAGSVDPLSAGSGAGGSSSDDPGRGGSDVGNGMAGQTETVSLEAGTYVFRAGELEVAIDPGIGGRVTRFGLAGTNILTGPEVVAGGEGTLPNMYGSTFWTSPQSDWNWPPEPEIDSAPHGAVLDGRVLTLSSSPGAATGYSVQKRFSLDAARRELRLEYTLRNESASRPVAPWEISRVPKEGLVLFPAAAEPLAKSTLPARLEGGVSWIDIAQAPPRDSKLFQDGSEGWLAYVYRDLVFIKVFEDIAAADQAPEEAEIEIFVNGSMDYVEVEQQGRYAMIPPGGSSAWRVTWRLERLPPAIPATLGSVELVDWVRAIALSTSR